MTLAEALAKLAGWLGVSPGDAAQVIASLLGTIGAVGAALAAWIAADATKKSVTEMREARLQGVRPTLLVETPSRLAISWTTNDKPKLLTLSSSYQPTDEVPAIKFQNVGNGPATDLIFEWVREDGRLWGNAEFSRIKDVFDLAGFTVDITPPRQIALMHHDYGGFHSILVNTGESFSVFRLGTCMPDKVTTFPLEDVRAEFVRAAAEGLLDDTSTPQLEQFVSAKFIIAYKSIAGEVFRRVFDLQIQATRQTFVLKDGETSTAAPTTKWVRGETQLLLSIRESTLRGGSESILLNSEIFDFMFQKMRIRKKARTRTRVEH